MANITLADIPAPTSAAPPTAAQASTGLPFQPAQLIGLLSPADWEAFTREWLQRLKKDYASVKQYAGPGDLGLDVVAFATDQKFDGEWDSYQCKHYSGALTPSTIWIELGKIIYHSFAGTPPLDGKGRVPRKHFFCAPKGVGLTAAKLLARPANLKVELKKNWEQHCRNGIGKDIDAELKGALLTYFEEFDFSVFDYKEPIELIELHRETAHHATRFGTPLPPKGAMPAVPATPAAAESVYLRKILDAYQDNTGSQFLSEETLASHPVLRANYDRQRVLFYSAEYLKGYSRETLPAGVFDALSEDIYSGVIDVAEGDHACGLTRMRQVITHAAAVNVSGNPLQAVSTPAERQGICHQLANIERLTWVK